LTLKIVAVMGYFDFEEMPVWQLALKVVNQTYRLTEQLPKKEDYALCGQLRKAAVSVTGNIAEGFGRGHPRDKVNFYYYARASAGEVKSHLLVGHSVGYFTKTDIQVIADDCNRVIEALNKIIRSIYANHSSAS
jgi:four helix bundle protein